MYGNTASYGTKKHDKTLGYCGVLLLYTLNNIPVAVTCLWT